MRCIGCAGMTQMALLALCLLLAGCGRDGATVGDGSAALVTQGVAPAPRPTDVPAEGRTADARRVFGSATFDGGERMATVTWHYARDGEKIESTVPPRMYVVAIAANLPRVMVKLPSELFGLRVGDPPLLRFDEPILVHTDQSVTCTCAMRDDCVAGVAFRCEIEATLADDDGAA